MESAGQLESALAALERAVAFGGERRYRLASLAYACARAGRVERARELLSSLMAEDEGSYVPPSRIAAVLLALGERSRALDWLERAFAERDNWLVFLAVAPEFDELRQEPRFAALIRQMSLPD